MTLETLATSILIFSHTYCLGFLLVITLMSPHRSYAIKLFPVLTISLFLNFMLKEYIQKPLPLGINSLSTYAFPSGHMQSACVFYGWLFVCTRQWTWIHAGIPLLLLGIGWGLVHKGYHDIGDVLGGVIVGITLITSYYLALKHTPLKKNITNAYTLCVLYGLGVWATHPNTPNGLQAILFVNVILGGLWYFLTQPSQCGCQGGDCHG